MVTGFRPAGLNCHLALGSYRNVHEEIDVRDDVFLAEAVRFESGKKIVAAVWSGFNTVAHAVTLAGAAATDRVVHSAGVADDGEEHVAHVRVEFRAFSNEQRTVDLHRVRCIVALRQIKRVVAEEVDGLPSLDVDET